MQKINNKFKIKTKIFLVSIIMLLSTIPIFAAVDGTLAMEAMRAKQEGNLNKIHAVAQKIISANPNDPYGYQLEAEFLHKSEKYNEAIKFYSKVIEKSKAIKEEDSIPLRKMGMSEQEIDKVLNFNSTISEAYNLRGMCFFKLLKPKEALNDFSEAEKYTNEQYFVINHIKSLCLAKLGQYDNALKVLKETKKITKDKEELSIINDDIRELTNFIKKQNKK